MILSIFILAILALSAIVCCIWLMRSNALLRQRVTEISVERAALESQIEALRSNAVEVERRYQNQLSEQEERHCRDQKAAEERNRQIREDFETQLRREAAQRAEEQEIRFKNLANAILGDTQRTFKEQHESRLMEILTPLRENIEQFRKSVDEKYTREAQERFSLKEKIEELSKINATIGQEAKELTLALRGNTKVQGDWGEMILENILRKSGMPEGELYVVQQTRDEEGNLLRDEQGALLRPDVVIYPPGSGPIVVDSKVSLTDYVKYVNADDAAERDAAARAHVASVRRHIDELARKKYQDRIGKNAIDFVMMFIPHEAAYIAALQLEPSLWQEAYDKRVVIISPTHLISTIKLIMQLWTNDKQSRNAIEIAVKSGQMLDKFADFVKDMEGIEKSLTSTRTAYDKAMNKLSTGTGNLVRRASQLKEMGAKATKQLPRDKTAIEE